MLRDKHHGEPCPYCLRKMDRGSWKLVPTRDHVMPVSRGGTRKIICCLTCNGIKGDMLPQQWEIYMANNPGWWLLSKAERRQRRGAKQQKYDYPNGNGDLIRGRPSRQGSEKLPVVVPPALIFNEVK